MPHAANIKTGLIAAILLLCGAAAIFFIDFQPTPRAPESQRIATDAGASILIKDFRQSSTRNGKTEWTMEAKSASLLPSRKIVLLENLKMKFFMDKGKELFLSADQGTMDTSTKDMSVRGNISVEYDNLRLNTELLQYENNHRIVFSSHRTTIAEDSLRLTADSFVVDLNKNHIEFIGHVACIFEQTL